MAEDRKQMTIQESRQERRDLALREEVAAAPGRARWAGRLLLLLALALALANSFFNPLFEAPDERLHYQFVRFLLDERRLPLQPQDDALTQYHQPPLYYLGGALLTAAIEDSGTEPTPNPFWLSYRPGELHRDNKAQFLPQEAYRFPYYGAALAVHLLRLWSLLLLAGTLLLFQRIGRALWPGDSLRQLLLFALAGLNPMLLYIGSSANNDNMVIFLATLLLWLALRGARRGFSPLLALAVGLVWGLAALSKITGLFLAAPAFTTLAWDAWRRRAWRGALPQALLILIVTSLFAGWWYVRNLLLYGELFGMERMLDIWGERAPGELDWPTLLSIGRYALETFWGRFAYGQIMLPVLFYLLFALLTACGLIGFIDCLWRLARCLLQGGPAVCPRSAEAAPWPALLAAAAVYLPAFFYFIWRNPSGANGRYIFPALIALVAFIVAGLWRLPYRRYLAVGVTAFMVAVAIVSLVWLVPWTYAAPPLRDLAELPQGQRAEELMWQPGMQLLGVQLLHRDLSAQSEPELELVACWRSLAAPERNYIFYVHLVDPDLNVLGARDTHPGLGNYPTSLWQPERSFCETYRVPLKNRPQGHIANVVAGFYDAATGEPMQAFDAAGSPLQIVVLEQVKVAASPLIASDEPPLASFAAGIGLQRYEWSSERVAPGDTVTLRVWWAADGPAAHSYTIFSHLLDSGGELVTQDDQLPQEGGYPTTFWGKGELIPDEYTFTIPVTASPGPTSLQLGFYLLADNSRLPRLDPDAGLPDAVELPGPLIAE